MNRVHFLHALTLGEVATYYHRDRKTFKKMIAPLIEGKLRYLKGGRTRKIFPSDQKLIAKFLGNIGYRDSFPKISLVSIARVYGWTPGQLNRNISSIREELKNAGFIPRMALTPRHAQLIVDYLGLPDNENDPLFKCLQIR